MKIITTEEIHNEDDKKELLLSLIQNYLSKDHIRMKEVLEFYYKRIDEEGYIYERHFKQIVPYLTRDLRRKPEFILKFFEGFISNTPYHQTDIQPPKTDLTRFSKDKKETMYANKSHTKVDELSMP